MWLDHPRGGVKPPDPSVATGWKAVATSLADYAKDAKDWGKSIGSSFTGAFQSAEGAFREFVKTGKVDFKSLISSLLADIALLAFRTSILGPIADAISSGGDGTIGSILSSIFHVGGVVGAAGAATRAVPALAFANAPRMHNGGVAGLRHDEVPAILQKGERVLSRQEVANGRGGGALDVRVYVDDDGNWQAEIERISGGVAGRTFSAGMKQYDRVLPDRISEIKNDPRLR